MEYLEITVKDGELLVVTVDPRTMYHSLVPRSFIGLKNPPVMYTIHWFGITQNEVNEQLGEGIALAHTDFSTKLDQILSALHKPEIVSLLELDRLADG